MPAPAPLSQSVLSAIHLTMERLPKTPSKTLALLQRGEAEAALAARFEELKLKPTLTPADAAEMSAVGRALNDLRSTKGASDFTSKPVQLSNLASGGIVDRVQGQLDNLTTATGVASMASAATGVGLVPGAIANTAGNLVDATNAAVDVLQAGAALLTGDVPGAAQQVFQGAMRAVSAVPILGDAFAASRAAKSTLRAGEELAKDVGAAHHAASLTGHGAQAAKSLTLKEAKAASITLPEIVDATVVGRKNIKNEVYGVGQGVETTVGALLDKSQPWGNLMGSLGATAFKEGSDAQRVLANLNHLGEIKSPNDKKLVLEHAVHALSNVDFSKPAAAANRQVIEQLRNGFTAAAQTLNQVKP